MGAKRIDLGAIDPELSDGEIRKLDEISALGGSVFELRSLRFFGEFRRAQNTARFRQNHLTILIHHGRLRLA
jgi:hypothetical protein